jgi:transcriptional regulator with XRE-family HTH domain
MKEVKESVSNEKLRQERFRQGWSQVDVANKVGSDPKTVGRWERGVTTPTPYFCQKLCQLYDKTPQELGLLKEDDSEQQQSDQQEHEPVSPSATSVIAEDNTLTKDRVLWWKRGLAQPGWLLALECGLALLLIVVAVIQFLPRQTSSPTSPTSPSISLNDPYTGTGALAFNDSLATNTADWSLNKNPEGDCRFQDSGYVIRGIKEGYMEVCLNNTSYFSNFVYEASMKITAGDCGGLAFRTNFPLLYYFIICQDGHYRLTRYDRDHVNLRRVIASGLSNIIHTGYGRSNTIAAVADGTTLNLYVNQHLLGHFTDNAYSSGQIGFIVHTCRVVYADPRPNLCTAPTQVLFQDAKVWKL